MALRALCVTLCSSRLICAIISTRAIKLRPQRGRITVKIHIYVCNFGSGTTKPRALDSTLQIVCESVLKILLLYPILVPNILLVYRMDCGPFRAHNVLKTRQRAND